MQGGIANIFVYPIITAMKPAKRGRPPLPAKERSTKQVHFRCTAAEKAEYKRKARAAQKGLSDWLKGLADEA